jgi:hypothetical protein
MAKLKYFGMAAINENIESVKNLRIRDACYTSDKNLLSSCLYFRNVKNKIYRTIHVRLLPMDFLLGLWHQGKIIH